MGKASSTKKVARAAKLGGTPKAKSYEPRSLLFPVSIGLVFVLGIFLVLYARGQNRSSIDKSVPYWNSTVASNKHIHNAYGIYICDKYAAPLSDAFSDAKGIHTHTDGLIHIHPFVPSVSGRSAIFKEFATQTGLKVSKTSIQIPGQKKLSNGDACPASADGTYKGGSGQMQFWIYATPTSSKPDQYTGDPNKIHFQRDETIVIAFVTSGTTIPKPTAMASLANPNAAEGGTPAPATGSSTTIVPITGSTVPGQTTTTVAGQTTSTVAGQTTTTVAGQPTITVGGATTTGSSTTTGATTTTSKAP